MHILSPQLSFRVADGSTLQATHKGIVEIHFTTSSNRQMNLRLMRVLYVPGLATRLFSIESFISNNRCSVLYSKGSVQLFFGNNQSVTLDLPHVPPGTYISRETHDISNLSGEERGFRTWIHQRSTIPEETYIAVDTETDTHHIFMTQSLPPDDPMTGGEETSPWSPSLWHQAQA